MSAIYFVFWRILTQVYFTIKEIVLHVDSNVLIFRFLFSCALLISGVLIIISVCTPLPSMIFASFPFSDEFVYSKVGCFHRFM